MRLLSIFIYFELHLHGVLNSLGSCNYECNIFNGHQLYSRKIGLCSSENFEVIKELDQLIYSYGFLVRFEWTEFGHIR